MYRYRVTSDAEADIIGIEQYVAGYAELAFVDDLDDAFLEAFEKLCENPFLHSIYQFEPPVSLLHEYRSVNVYRYKVFYWIDEDEIEIYRVCHVAADFTRQMF